MPDRISTYRQVRLVLQIPSEPRGRSYWSLHAVGVRNGVPSSVILLDGFAGHLSNRPTTEEILEALDAAIRGSMLKG